MALIFNVDMGTAKHHAEVGGVDERGTALAHGEEGVGAGDGEELAVAPQVKGTVLKGGREQGLEVIEVIASFAPLAGTAGA